MAPQGLVHGPQYLRALLEPLAVDVIQGKLRLTKSLAAHTVPYDVSGEDGAARAHKCDFKHKLFSFLIYPSLGFIKNSIDTQK